jgi:hypothetical protein
MHCRTTEDLSSKTPELIQILHVGEAPDADAYFYVMPLADHAAGGVGSADTDYLPMTLQRRLDRRGPMEWDDAIGLLAVIARGAAALHHAGLCHGDISSDNVLWVDGLPVLADPGLTSLEHVQQRTGSQGFLDSNLASGKTGDVFALGRLLYHAVTGTHPAEAFPAIPQKRMAELPVAELAMLLDRCCDPDPANRFADANELLAHLEPETVTVQKQRPVATFAMVLGMMGLAALAGWKFTRPPDVEYLARIDGKRLMLHTNDGGKLLWERVFEHPLGQAEPARLNGGNDLVVLCSMRDTGSDQPGRLVAMNLDGSVRWEFEAVPEVRGFSGPGQGAMKIAGFMTSDQGEVVILARNTTNLYSSAIKILDSHGKLRASYWHPGRIELSQIIMMRDHQDDLPLLAFFGENELAEPSINEENLTVTMTELVLGAINPEGSGQVHTPMHRISGPPGSSPLLWYGMVAPPGTIGRSLYGKPTDDGGLGRLALAVELPMMASTRSQRNATIEVTIDGAVPPTSNGQTSLLMADSFDPLPAGLEPVDFKKLTPARMIAHSLRDFTHQENGGTGWHYGYAPENGGGYSPANFRHFTLRNKNDNVGRLAWHNACGTHLSIEAHAMHPSEDSNVVRRWVSPYSGRIAVVANFIRVKGAEWGITSLEIHHGSRQISRTLLGKTRFQAVFHVEKGDTLDFVINAEGRDWGDHTHNLIGIWSYD